MFSTSSKEVLRRSRDNVTCEATYRNSNPQPVEWYHRETVSNYVNTREPFKAESSKLSWLCDNVYPKKLTPLSVQRQDVDVPLSYSTAPKSLNTVDSKKTEDPFYLPSNFDRINQDKNNNFGACIFTVTGVPKSPEYNRYDSTRDYANSAIDRRKPVDSFPDVSLALERYGRRHKYIDERMMTNNPHDHSSGTYSSRRYLHKTFRPYGSVYRMERELRLGDIPTDALQCFKQTSNSHREGQRLLFVGKNTKDRRLGTGSNKSRGRRYGTAGDSHQAQNVEFPYNARSKPVDLPSMLSGGNSNETEFFGRNIEISSEPTSGVDEEHTLSVAELKLRFSEGSNTPRNSKINSADNHAELERSKKCNNRVDKPDFKASANKREKNSDASSHKSSSGFFDKMTTCSPVRTLIVDPNIDQNNRATHNATSRIDTNRTTMTEQQKIITTSSQATAPITARQPAAVNVNPFTAKDLDFGWIDDDDVLCDDFYAGNQSFSTTGQAENDRSRNNVTCCVLEEEDEGDDSDESTAEVSYIDNSYKQQRINLAINSPFLSPQDSEGGYTDITDNTLDAIVGFNQFTSSPPPEKKGNVNYFGKNVLRSFVDSKEKRDDMVLLKQPVSTDSLSIANNVLVDSRNDEIRQSQLIDCVTSEVEDVEEKRVSIIELVETFEGLTNPFLRTGSFRKYAQGAPTL